MKRSASRSLYQKALSCFPGGVNSPVRAFKAVGGVPLFIEKAQGAKLRDADGNELIDYVMSWGALILGHAAPAVVRAVSKAARLGTSYGTPTRAENLLAEEIKKTIPSVERLRFVSSGTEAAMSAVRLARGFTGRSKIVKFEGGYHGHHDSFLVKAGSGVATQGLSDSAGVPGAFARETLVCPYNDYETFDRILRRHTGQIAAVIVEPVAANMGVVPPEPFFLESLRARTVKEGILLIFDEVITGFRLGYGGAQARYGVKPDLTCLGKIIGGGLPLAAYGGRKEIMAQVAPLGPVYQAGTLSGNPVAVAGGLAALRELKKADYGVLEKKTETLCRGLSDVFSEKNISFSLNRAGSLFTVFFCEGPVRDFKGAKRSNARSYARFFHGLLERGIYFAPSPFEAQFVSFSHASAHLAKTIKAASEISF